MKIYAKQVPPEYQESPLLMLDEWPENVAIFGNPGYKEHCFDFFNRTWDALFHYNNGLLDWWDTFQVGNNYGETWEGILNDLVPPRGREPYTRHERKNVWPALALEADALKNQNAIMCKALELITGRRWDCYTLRGCCQGDWQYMIYPADEWSRDDLARFETEYFNTGTEWLIDPDGDSVSVYVTAWDDDGTRQELADAYGCEPSDIILQTFTGWSRTAQYMEVPPC